MEKKEKKDNKEVKDLVKRAEETASQGKKETSQEKPEVKDLKTPLKKEPKPEPKPDPEKEALKDQVKILTERVGSIEGLLKEASEAARQMQGQGQTQEGLTDEEQLQMLQQQQAQEQGQGQAQPATTTFGASQYFLLDKLFDMLGKVVPGAMAKSSGGDSSGPEGVLKQLSFWFDAFTKLQSNLLTGLRLLPQSTRDQAFKGAVGSPPEEKEKEEPRHISG